MLGKKMKVTTLMVLFIWCCMVGMVHLQEEKERTIKIPTHTTWYQDTFGVKKERELSVSEMVFQMPSKLWRQMKQEWGESWESLLKLPHRDQIDISQKNSFVELAQDGTIKAVVNNKEKRTTMAAGTPCRGTYLKHSRYLAVNQTSYYCNGTIVTEEYYKEHKNDTSLNCTTKFGQLKRCACSLDRINSNCGRMRIFKCEPYEWDPPACEKPTYAKERGGVPMNGDFSCRDATATTTTTVKYGVKCRFETAPQWESEFMGIDLNNVYFTDLVTNENLTWAQVRASFSYFTEYGLNPTTLDATFALVSPLTTPIAARPIDYSDLTNSLRDTYYSLNMPGHYNGTQPITMFYDFNLLKNNTFYPGNRAWFEFGFRPNGNIRGSYAITTFNMVDRNEPPYSNITQLILSITIPIAVALALAFVALVVAIYFYRKRKASKEMKAFFE